MSIIYENTKNTRDDSCLILDKTLLINIFGSNSNSHEQ